MPAVRLAAYFRQGAAAGHPSGHPSADQSPRRTPGSHWPGDGHGGPLDRPVGRTPQFEVTAQPMVWTRSGQRRQAADTSSAQRPTMPLASRPRPTTRPARPGPDRTGQDGTAPCSPSANPSRYQHRDPSVVTTCAHARCRNVASLVPVRCPRGRVRRPRWTPRSDSLPDTACPVDPAGHRPLHPARHGEPEATRTGTDERHGRRSDSLDRQDHKAAHRDTPSPRLWGRRLQLGNQGWPGDSKIANATVTTAATRQLLGVAPPSKLRLGALLSSDDYGSRVDRAEGVHPLWRGLL
jgi:hypothetical protein